MRIIDAGHEFELQPYDGENYQFLKFFKRIGKKFPGNNPPAYSGTNCQEVLRALISRVLYLNKQDPCDENALIIHHLRESLNLFEIRAAKRHKLLSPKFGYQIENYISCPKCGNLEGVCVCEKTERSS